MRILLAMSGGVDSSTVAHLLKEQGHDIVGVRFTLWSDPLAPPLAQILPSKCCNTQTASRVREVCNTLSIPLHILNLEDAFKSHVVDPFLEGYAQGITPNPCIGCNRTLKFGKLIELMEELGCDRLATGHYARTARERLADGSEKTLLLEAVDTSKDQSYYLYGLTQEQLSRVLFPLGGMMKRDVMSLARHYRVPLPDRYQESQDLCFFPEKSPHAFLRRHLAHALEPGEIVRRDGTVVGAHEGLPLYTVGQRRGLKIGGLKVPLEVVEKDSASNRLVVAEKGAEQARSITVSDLRWISWQPPEGEETTFQYRTRSLSPKRRGTLRASGSQGTFVFDTPEPPQAPGQSLVLYRGEEVVGGGVIVRGQ